MKTEVIVVAAGTGKRLNSRVPKALVSLKGKPLVSYCLKVFNGHPDVDGIILVGVKKHLGTFKRIAQRFKKVRAVVPGGLTRSASVKCGLKALSTGTSMVLVHDAARPFIDGALVSRLTAALKKHKAAIVGMPVKFTLKKINTKALDIQETPARESFWEAQTPQGFHRNILVKAHGKVIKEEVTDDAMLVERMGCGVKMLTGSYRNIKVTTLEDLLLAKQLALPTRGHGFSRVPKPVA